MLRDDVTWALNMVGELWPWFADPKHATETRTSALADVFGRCRCSREQVEAILKDAWTGQDSGFPPVSKITARLKAASQGYSAKPSEMSEHDARAKLAELIEYTVKWYGLEALFVNDPRTNLHALSWCKRAKSMGMSVPAIVANATKMTEDEARDELMGIARRRKMEAQP